MPSPASLIGHSSAALAIQEEIGYAAQCDAKVLIAGESGVGKEVVARLIHQRSGRARLPWVAINCAGVPDSLLESELFGHVRGSFTDAHADKRGLLESANGGTVFLDEIGEMSPRMQPMLLRFLETGEIQRIGSDRRLPPLDVRVVAATHRRLIDDVANKRFREDLYYRLNVIYLEIPPLRDRREDIALLLQHALELFATSHRRPLPSISPEALECLEFYRWPGNVRELRNICERAVLQNRTGTLELASLPLEIRSRQPARVAASNRRPISEELFEGLARQGASFWSTVHEPFMARDLTRSDRGAGATRCVVLVDGPRAVHGPRPDAERSPRIDSAGTGAHPRQLQVACPPPLVQLL